MLSGTNGSFVHCSLLTVLILTPLDILALAEQRHDRPIDAVRVREDLQLWQMDVRDELMVVLGQGHGSKDRGWYAALVQVMTQCHDIGEDMTLE